MVKELVGVDLGINPGFILSHRQIDEDIPPSGELLQALMELPPGSSVGIVEVPGYLLDLRADSASYYQEDIQKSCERLGLNVIGLDNQEILQQYQNAVWEAERIQGALNTKFRFPGTRPSPADLESVRDLYKHIVTAQHIYYVQRYEEIREKVVETNPDIIIVDAGYTGQFLLDRDSILDQGVPFPEQIVLGSQTVQGIQVNSEETLSISNAVDLDIERLEKELLARRFRAVTEGRITQGDPKYIGYWLQNGEIEGPERGLFEIFSGETGEVIIEDSLGSAIGQFKFDHDSGQISFSKAYNRSRSSEKTPYRPLEYKGERRILENGTVLFVGIVDYPPCTFVMYEYDSVKDKGTSWMDNWKEFKPIEEDEDIY